MYQLFQNPDHLDFITLSLIVKDISGAWDADFTICKNRLIIDNLDQYSSGCGG